MNTLTLTMISFIIGVCFAVNAYSTHYMNKADVEAAIIEAYNIGKAQCPSDTHCIEHGQVSGLVRLTLNDVEEILR